MGLWRYFRLKQVETTALILNQVKYFRCKLNIVCIRCRQAFEDEVRNHQPEVDRVTKTSRQLPEPSPATPSSLTRRGVPLRKGWVETAIAILGLYFTQVHRPTYRCTHT